MNWSVILFAYISLFVFGLSDNLRGPLYPEILSRFAVNHSQASLFFSVASLINFLGAWLAPRLIGRFGHVASLRVGMLLMAVACAGFAFAPSFEVLIGFAAIFGVAIGVLGVTQNLIVLLASDAQRRSRVQSGLHACNGASSLLAPWLAFGFAAIGINWQKNFLIPGLLAALWLAASFMNKGLNQPLHSEAELETGKAPVQRLSWAQNYWAVLFSLYVSVEILLGSRLTVFLREGRGFSIESASFWLTAFFAGLFFGRLFFAFLHLKLKLHIQMLLLLLFGGLAFVLGLAYRAEYLSLTGLGLAGFYPLWMSSLQTLFAEGLEKLIARAIGYTSFSVVAMHSGVGFLSDAYGLDAGIGYGLILVVVMALMILLYPFLFRRSLP